MNQQSNIKLTITVNEDSSRLDVYLVKFLQQDLHSKESLNSIGITSPSRSLIQKWIEGGHVTINSKVVTKRGSAISVGDNIEIIVEPPKPINLDPDSSVEFEVVFEDDDILVINKPAGLVVHPGAGNDDKTLVNGLLYHLGDSIKAVGDSLRPGIVHRLDQDTSGLMVVAKNNDSFIKIQNQFKPPRTIHRIYHALVTCIPNGPYNTFKEGSNEQSGTITGSIARSNKNRLVFCIDNERGKEAKTHWKVIKHLENAILVECELETGRTHQIRCHFNECNSSLIGDQHYKRKRMAVPNQLLKAEKNFGRQALHAFSLSFLHPRTKDVTSFSVERPSDFEELIEKFS